MISVFLILWLVINAGFIILRQFANVTIWFGPSKCFSTTHCQAIGKCPRNYFVFLYPRSCCPNCYSRGHFVTSKFCSDVVFRKIGKQFNKVCPSTGMKGMHCLNDNAPAHCYWFDFFFKKKMTFLKHALYSSDFAPFDFFFLPWQKKVLQVIAAGEGMDLSQQFSVITKYA
jgi:hypothetical protein